ncbi:hypothetical protein DITRI_Ditri07aG0057600 [Diplodiscus trichospermus]
MVKINFDGAWQKESLIGGLVVIVKQKRGDVMKAYMRKVSHIGESNVSKAKAALAVIESAKDMGFSDIIIEGAYALGRVNKLKCMNKDLSLLRTVIEEIAKCFQVCIFQFVYKDANRAAHSLARCAC